MNFDDFSKTGAARVSARRTASEGVKNSLRCQSLSLLLRKIGRIVSVLVKIWRPLSGTSALGRGRDDKIEKRLAIRSLARSGDTRKYNDLRFDSLDSDFFYRIFCDGVKMRRKTGGCRHRRSVCLLYCIIE